MSVAAVGAEAATEGLPPTAAQACAWAPGDLNSTCSCGDAACDADPLFDRSTDAAGGYGACSGGPCAEEPSPWVSSSSLQPCRDVLPLPLGRALDAVLAGAHSWGGSSAQRRKGRRQRAMERDLRGGIRALNELGAPRQLAVEERPLSQQQQRAVQHLVRNYAAVGTPPVELEDALGAWKSLQGEASGYADEASRSRVSFEQGRVSLFPAAFVEKLLLVTFSLQASSSCSREKDFGVMSPKWHLYIQN